MRKFIFLILLTFLSCQKETVVDDVEDVVENVENTYSIEIYGNDNCYYTTKLRNECTKLNINSQYFSLSNYDNVKKEIALTDKYFSSRIITTSYIYNGQTIIQRSSDINLPIVLITYNTETYCLERPNIEDVKKLIKY